MNQSEGGDEEINMRTVFVLYIVFDGRDKHGRRVVSLQENEDPDGERGVSLEIGGKVLRECDVGEVVGVPLKEFEVRDVFRIDDLGELIELFIGHKKNGYKAANNCRLT